MKLRRSEKSEYPECMTTREEIYERIAKMDEALLPELLEEIDSLERVQRLKAREKPKDEAAIARAEARLDKAIEQAMAESGLTRDELADLFTIRRDDEFSC